MTDRPENTGAVEKELARSSIARHSVPVFLQFSPLAALRQWRETARKRQILRGLTVLLLSWIRACTVQEHEKPKISRSAHGSELDRVARGVVLLGLTCLQVAGAAQSEVGLVALGSRSLPVSIGLAAIAPIVAPAMAMPVLKNGYKVSVGTEWVQLQTSIWNPQKNCAVLGLTKEDFELFEDGQRRQVDLCFASETPFHLVLLLDVSASTTPFIKTLRKAATHFLDVLRPADRVAVIAFNSKVTVLQSFTADRQKAKEAIRATTPEGNTALYDALVTSLQLLQSVKGRKAIVLSSDGADNRLSDPQYGSKATFDELHMKVLNADSLIYSVFLRPTDPMRAQTR